MSENETLLVFPFEPDKISKSQFMVLEFGDFPTPEDVEELIDLMWRKSEIEFRYYHPKSSPLEQQLLVRVNDGTIHANDSERHFYKHPKFQLDYVKIARSIENARWDWERDIVANGEEFWQTILTLSPIAKIELDTRHKIELEEKLRLQRKHNKYTFDAFLSYSTTNNQEAEFIHATATSSGLRILMAPKILVPGDDFAEEIRISLLGSVELWLLLSPQSICSEWVISEWGAAWVLEKLIVPILHRCEPDLLPNRIARYNCIDLHRVNELISDRVDRKSRIE